MFRSAIRELSRQNPIFLRRGPEYGLVGRYIHAIGSGPRGSSVRRRDGYYL